MKVRDVIDLLSYGTHWQLIGARTGKKLCNSHSKKHKDEYMEYEAYKIFPSFYTQKSAISGTCDFMCPMINIWVWGE